MGRKLGAVPLLKGELGTPSNTKSPGPRPTSTPSGILVHPAVSPQQTWPENWKLCPFREELGPRLIQCRLAEAYLRTKWHLDPSNRLATVHQRYRQDRQDRRTLLQTVAQKRKQF